MELYETQTDIQLLTNKVSSSHCLKTNLQTTPFSTTLIIDFPLFQITNRLYIGTFRN